MREQPRKPKGGMVVSIRQPNICCLMEDGGTKPNDKKKLRRRLKRAEKQLVAKQMVEDYN